MSSIDEKFFNENVVQVNNVVANILLVSAIVPISFISLTIAGIWIVPHAYSVGVLCFSIFSSMLVKHLNSIPKTQNFVMYFGVMCTIAFVALLGMEKVINVSICYALPTFLSCLYYNKKLARRTAIITYIVLAFVYVAKSADLKSTYMEFDSQLAWFISYFSGVTIEFIFVFILVTLMSGKTHKTLQDLVILSEERNQAVENMLMKIEESETLNSQLEQKNNELHQTQYDIIQFVAQCLGSHDLFTGRHVIHTQKYVEVICKKLVSQGLYTEELTPSRIKTFVSAAFLHDIGKLHIPEGVLNKVGRFTPEEFDLMKCHPEEGKKLLEFLPPIDGGAFNQAAANMACCHHEKWDGSGYPNKLKGTQIPLEARIMAAADVLDALISQRLYKEPMSLDEAMEVFKKSRGTHFEECIADCVINSKEIIEEIDKNYKDTESKENLHELQWWLRYHESVK